jgi:hypothetical protein
VESHHAGVAVDRQVQGRDVGVAEQDFRVLADQREVQVLQQRDAAGAAADRPDRFHVRVAEHAVQIGDAGRDGAAVIAPDLAQVVALLDAEAQRFDVFDGLLDRGVAGVAAGRDEADQVAFWRRGGLIRCFMGEVRERVAAALENDAGSSSDAAASLPKPRLLILLLFAMLASGLNNEKRPVGRGDALPGRRAVADTDDQKNL